MSIKEKIANRIKECMKSGNSFERDVLKTVLGEIQSIELSKGKISEEDCEKVFRKFKQGVEETIKLMKNDKEVGSMEKEIEIYNQYIPQTMSAQDIADTLDGYPVMEDIRCAPSDGAAVGIAMRFFKQNSNFKVVGKDVSEAVKILRVE